MHKLASHMRTGVFLSHVEAKHAVRPRWMLGSLFEAGRIGSNDMFRNPLRILPRGGCGVEFDGHSTSGFAPWHDVAAVAATMWHDASHVLTPPVALFSFYGLEVLCFSCARS